MEKQQAQVHKNRGGQSLEDGNHRGLFADVLQLLQPELRSDGEGDEAQGNITDESQLIHKLIGGQTQMGNAQSTQAQRPDQQARHQIAGDVRQVEPGGQAGQKQPSKHSQTNGEQVFHIECLFS